MLLPMLWGSYQDTSTAWDSAWLRYDSGHLSQARVDEYRGHLRGAVCVETACTTSDPQGVVNATTQELVHGITNLLNLSAADVPVQVQEQCECGATGVILRCGGGIVETPEQGGYTITSTTSSTSRCIEIASTHPSSPAPGLLHGGFSLLRMVQSNQSVDALNVSSAPANELRMWNLWDNIDESIERGYAGKSIFDWSALPGTVDKRYTDYARLLASVGTSDIVFLNVNSCKNGNTQLLSSGTLAKVPLRQLIMPGYNLKP